jgi:putative methyltransferase (TIGR04325 family)
MYLHDYPAMFWLAKFADAGSSDWREASNRLVDFGGNLGEKQRVFDRLHAIRSDIEWVVLETPAAVEAGRALAETGRSARLSFTSDRAVLDGAKILFASGSLQYLECDLCAIIDTLVRAPEYLVLNQVPLSEGPEVWTLQVAGGKVVVPYHVMNRLAFLAGLADRGYRVIDEWKVPQFRVRIRFHDHPGTECNSGLSLARNVLASGHGVPAAG